jgi:hypothetical protein
MVLKVLHLAFAAAPGLGSVLGPNLNDTTAFQLCVDSRPSFPRKPRRLRQSHKQEF